MKNLNTPNSADIMAKFTEVMHQTSGGIGPGLAMTLLALAEELENEINELTKTGKALKTPIPDNVKFIYIGDRHRHDHNGIITIANAVIDDEIQYGVSYCSPKDAFSKEEGRKIATKRMYENMIPLREKNHHQIKMQILSDIYAVRKYPSWAGNLIESTMMDTLFNLV
jgi:hypothetical protein